MLIKCELKAAVYYWINVVTNSTQQTTDICKHVLKILLRLFCLQFFDSLKLLAEQQAWHPACKNLTHNLQSCVSWRLSLIWHNFRKVG